jgi:hypothetical protein
MPLSRLESLLSHLSPESVNMEQPNGTNGDTSGRPLTPPVDVDGNQESAEQSTYSVLPQWHSKQSHVRVIHVGAGAAGILMAYKMQKNNVEL